MHKRTPLRKGTVLEGRYRISRRLGSGGMGAVYEAEDLRLKNRLVALKETFADTEETRQAFEREAELLANTSHDAFPCVIDYFTEADGCFLVMELVRGDDLAGMLSERKEPFEEAQVLDWADQILDALEDLHAQKIIHRDIKPANIKLTPHGRIKLLDFGIAKGNAGDAAITTVGSLAATLQYAPLEQVLRADANYHAVLSVNFAEKVEEVLRLGTDARTDLYALGATLYQLLTKRLPRNAPTRATSIWSGLKDTLRPVSELNPHISFELSAALQKVLEIERNDRPASAAEMRRLLLETQNVKIADSPKRQTLVLEEENTFISQKKSISSDSIIPQKDNGKIEIKLDNRKNTPFSPKFEPIPESRRIFISVTSVLLITLLAFCLWFLRIRTVSTVEASKPVNGQIQVETNSERENKDKNFLQTKQSANAKFVRKPQLFDKNGQNELTESVNLNEVQQLDTSQTRPRRIISAKSLEDVILERQQRERNLRK